MLRRFACDFSRLIAIRGSFCRELVGAGQDFRGLPGRRHELRPADTQERVDRGDVVGISRSSTVWQSAGTRL